jgi:hypothetical protein
MRDDARTIWQNQSIEATTEASTMTLEKIRRKTQELHAKARRELLGTVAGPLAVAFCYGFSIREFPRLQEMLHPLFASALAWSLAGMYFLNRGKWSAAMPGDTGFSAGLEFCRREIERRRDYFHRVLLWGFGPVILAILGIILALAIAAGRQIFPKGLPFLLLVAGWIIGYFVKRLGQQRELQREIDELNQIERENGR